MSDDAAPQAPLVLHEGDTQVLDPEQGLPGSIGTAHR